MSYLLKVGDLFAFASYFYQFELWPRPEQKKNIRKRFTTRLVYSLLIKYTLKRRIPDSGIVLSHAQFKIILRVEKKVHEKFRIIVLLSGTHCNTYFYLKANGNQMPLIQQSASCKIYI